MKYFLVILIPLGLMIPLACNNLTPINPGSGSRQITSPTSTPTNLNGWTSTPTATLQPTPAFVDTVSSGISAPNGLAYANSDVYVAEGDGASVSQVQVLNASNNTVNWTWTASGANLFQYPNGVAVNSAGTTVYVLDVNDTSGDGIIYALAPAAVPTPITSWTTYNGTTLGAPGGIALDSSGNVYIADTDNGLLEEFGPTGTTIASWDQNGAYGPVQPIGVAVDASNNVYVADGNNEELWVLSLSGSTFTVSTHWYLPFVDTGSDLADYGLAVDSSKNVYVADYFKSQVEVYTNSGSLIGNFNGNETGATPLVGPDALLLYNSDIYIGDYDSNSGSSGAGIMEIFGPNNY